MKEISVQVKDKVASLVDKYSYIVAYNTDFTIKFEFDEEWNEPSHDIKTARFYYNKGYEERTFEGDTVSVPPLHDTTNVLVGVYSGELYTTTPCSIYVKKAILDYGGEHIEPSEDVYNQLINLINGKSYTADDIQLLNKDGRYSADSIEGAFTEISDLLGYIEKDAVLYDDTIELTVSTKDGVSNADGKFASHIMLIPGETYKVTLDDVEGEYTCVLTQWSERLIIADDFVMDARQITLQNSTATSVHIKVVGDKLVVGTIRTLPNSSLKNGEGVYSIAQTDCEATGMNSSALGIGTVATGYGAHAEGGITEADGVYAHTEGIMTWVSDGGYAAHAEGVRTQVTEGGYAAHAEGQYASAEGQAAHAEGYYTVASGGASHAEGLETEAKEQGAHAEGGSCIAEGKYTHAEGEDTVAKGRNSHAEGEGTYASARSQHVQGTFNVKDGTTATYADIVGWGTSDTARKNIEATTVAGDKKLKGDVYVHANDDSTGGKKLATEEFVTSNIDSVTAANVPIADVEERYDAENIEDALKEVSDRSGYLERNAVVIDETIDCDGSIEDEYFYYDFGRYIPLIPGQNYTVVINGETYTSTAMAGEDIYADYKGEVYLTANNGPIYETKFTIANFGDFSCDDVDGFVNPAKIRVIGPRYVSTPKEYAPFGYIFGPGSGMFSIESWDAFAAGYQSIAFGTRAKASNSYSRALGSMTTASGDSAVALGVRTTASGKYSIASGSGSMASADYAVAFGNATKATGVIATSEGQATIAKGDISHAEGDRTYAGSRTQHAQGRFNVHDDAGLYADIVGWGTADTVEGRKNIEATTVGGDKKLKGDVYVECADDSTGGKKLATEEYVNSQAVELEEYTNAEIDAFFDE